ncbi:MAG: hypothetical protein M4D80_26590 [Myxococcota bacterium]|nr:hypothetical protein [Myxococcota bacterium]
MIKLLVLVVALAACGGSKKDSSDPGTGSGMSGQTGVDPTVPSWTPDSCKAYQKAVFQAVNCEKMEKAKRDEIQASYDTAAASWKAEQNATEAKIAEVGQSCTSSTESVRAAIGDLCVTPAQ